ncbi:hypothetical protein CN285_22075 [Bacillus cereus]|nr:hypothetical protein CN285_22075 [Bacillus cereus]PGM55581.1 hypothetical protein CN947_24840 [Bacillus cereus]
MRSLGTVVTFTICSAILSILNFYSCYDKYTTGNIYFCVNAALALFFLIFFMNKVRDIIRKNYIPSGE